MRSSLLARCSRRFFGAGVVVALMATGTVAASILAAAPAGATTPSCSMSFTPNGSPTAIQVLSTDTLTDTVDAAVSGSDFVDGQAGLFVHVVQGTTDVGWIGVQSFNLADFNGGSAPIGQFLSLAFLDTYVNASYGPQPPAYAPTYGTPFTMTFTVNEWSNAYSTFEVPLLGFATIDQPNTTQYCTADMTVQLNQATSTTSLAADPATQGSASNLTATTSAPGNVEFKDGVTVITGCAAVATTGTDPGPYTAVCSWTPASDGSHSITANYTDSDELGGVPWLPVHGDSTDTKSVAVVANVNTPTSVHAVTPGPGSRTTVVSWTPPAGGPTPDGYQVRCMPVGTAYNTGPNQEVVYTGATASPVAVNGLVRGLDYRCMVRARYTTTLVSWTGDGHEGPLSDWSNTFTVPKAVPPSPINVRASQPSPSGLSTTVSFTQPADTTTGAPVTGYGVRCVSSNGGATRTAVGTASPINVSGLSTGRTYTCTATASNSVGPSSGSSPTGAVKVPGTVTNVHATAPGPSRSTTVSFVAPTVNGAYTVSRYQARCVSANGGTMQATNGFGSPLTVVNLTHAKTYTCQVKVIYTDGSQGPLISDPSPITVP